MSSVLQPCNQLFTLEFSPRILLLFKGFSCSFRSEICFCFPAANKQIFIPIDMAWLECCFYNLSPDNGLEYYVLLYSTQVPRALIGKTEDWARFYGLFKYVPDFFSYWSQIFLMLAMAVERYFLIARGTEAKSLFTPKRRKTLYAVTLTACIAVPTVHLLDFAANSTLAIDWEEITPMTEKVSSLISKNWIKEAWVLKVGQIYKFEPWLNSKP